MALCARRRLRLRLVGRRLPLLLLPVLLLLLPAGGVGAWDGTEYAGGAAIACSASSGSCAAALGEPDTGASCSALNLNGWLSNLVTGQEWLRVGFDVPLYSSGLSVWESKDFGRVTGIELEDTDGGYHTVSAGVDGTSCSGTAPVVRTWSWALTSYRVRAVKLTFSLTAQRAGVSAVGLVGSDIYATPVPGATGTPGPTATPILVVIVNPTATPVTGIGGGDEVPTPAPPTIGITGDDWQNRFLHTSWGVVSTPGHPLQIVVPSLFLGGGISLFKVLFAMMAGFAIYLLIRLVMVLIP